jgi:hypothetical protein
VFGLEGDGFEDEEVEGALDEIGGLGHTMIIYNGDCRLSRYEVGWGAKFANRDRKESRGQMFDRGGYRS